jgi:hypothetical protein
MQNIGGKKRAGQGNVDSDCRFGRASSSYIRSAARPPDRRYTDADGVFILTNEYMFDSDFGSILDLG